MRYIGKCYSGHTTAMDYDGDKPQLILRCRSCDGPFSVRLTPVTATRGKRDCGDWCTDASGRTCTCVCEGRNHGSRYTATGALWHAR